MNIVFDFGAVLFDWNPAQLVAHTLTAHLGGACGDATALAHAIFGHPDWKAFDCGVIDMDSVVATTARRLGIPAADIHALVAPIGEQLMPIASTVALVQQLAAMRARGDVSGLYFLSNMPAPFGRVLEARHAFLAAFDGGIYSGDVGLAKPDARIYALLQERHALTTAPTVFIDDLPANLLPAQALGWHPLHCQAPGQLAAQVWERMDSIRALHGGTTPTAVAR